MSWIEFHADLRDHWKVHRLKDILKIRYAEALGLVACLWTWAANQAQNGDLKRFTNDEISAACRWHGASKNVVEALQEAKFLTEKKMIHDWGKYGLKLLLSSRKRSKLYRDRHVTRTSPSRKNHAYHTIPNHTNPPISPLGGTPPAGAFSKASQTPEDKIKAAEEAAKVLARLRKIAK